MYQYMYIYIYMRIVIYIYVCAYMRIYTTRTHEGGDEGVGCRKEVLALHSRLR